MTVRALRAGDRAAVLAQMRQLWGAADEADLDEETVFVWSDGDEAEPEGFAAVSLRQYAEGCHGSPVPFLEGWFVAEARRGTGAGRALIEAVEDWARAEGFDELGSDARLDNVEGVRAHRRLGFQMVERLQCFRKSLLPAPDPQPIRIEPFTSARASIRWLFELAEDSAAALDSYLDAGQLLVAVRGQTVIGHLQLVPTDRADQAEIKSMAVRPADQGQGVGRQLLAAGIELAIQAGSRAVLVATAAADVDNLRFYQRNGFRLRSVERDAFIPAAGYPDDLQIDGIPLRDRVWLDRECGPQPESDWDLP